MIDCVVVNYRTNDDLAQFVESFRLYAPAEANLTIVDVDPITPFGYKVSLGAYLTSMNNIGFNKACNLAAKDGKGDIIALFNADIILSRNTIQDCAKALREHDDWAIVGPLQFNERSRITHAGIFGTHAQPKHRGWNSNHIDDFRDVRQAVSVSGSAYFIKRKVWESLTACPIYQNVFPDAEGAFLPVQHYYGETGCSYHAWIHGYKVVYYGEASCIHKWHRASPVGQIEKQTMAADQTLFRKFCDEHGIQHD